PPPPRPRRGGGGVPGADAAELPPRGSDGARGDASGAPVAGGRRARGPHGGDPREPRGNVVAHGGGGRPARSPLLDRGSALARGTVDPLGAGVHDERRRRGR